MWASRIFLSPWYKTSVAIYYKILLKLHQTTASQLDLTVLHSGGVGQLGLSGGLSALTALDAAEKGVKDVPSQEVATKGTNAPWAREASLLDTSEKRLHGSAHGDISDGARLLDGNELVADEGGGLALGNNGVDGDGGGHGTTLEDDALNVASGLLGEDSAGGQDGLAGLGGEGSVGDLDLLGDLVGEDGDSEDGGQAGNGQDGADDDGGLHALDGALDVGELSLEAGHGGSSLGFHDCRLLFVSFFSCLYENVFVKVAGFSGRSRFIYSAASEEFYSCLWMDR